MWKRALAGVLILALGLLAVAVAHALSLRSRQITAKPMPGTPKDFPALAERLSEAIRIRTVSYEDRTKVDGGEFRRLHEFLEHAYPLVHRTLDREVVDGYSLLYGWKGSDSSLAPIVLSAHQDVVPAEGGADQGWPHAPFSGDIAGGAVWGRGALDDKQSIVCILEAVEALLAADFQPRRTVYLAFGHDEELGGLGAARMAQLLDSRGVRPELLLDEGGAVSVGMVDGVNKPVAAVAVAEKGYADITISAKSAAGHTSMPPAHTAIGMVSRAVARIESHPAPATLSPALRQTLEYIAPEMPLAWRIPTGNLWLFGKVLSLAVSGTPAGNASVRTVCSATLFQAGDKANALPASASATLNCRVQPGDSVAATMARLRAAIDDPAIHLEAHDAQEPTQPAPLDNVGAQGLRQSIAALFPDSVFAPIVSPGATDARHYGKLTPNLYRFTPMHITDESMHEMHGPGEHIPVEECRRAARFYADLLLRLGGKGR